MPRARSPVTARSSSAGTAVSHNPRRSSASRLSGRVGAGLDPCGAVQVVFDLAAGQERETSFKLGVGRSIARSSGTGSAFSPRRRVPRRAGGGLVLLEPDARRGECGHAGSRGEPDGERLAALPDIELPPVGPHRILSIRRRLRLPRPVAGLDGPGACGAGAHPRTSAPRRGPAVQGGRRPALVASAGGTGREDAFFRRLSVAALRHLPLRFKRGGHRRARRNDPFPRSPSRQARRGGILRSAVSRRGSGHALSTLRALDQAGAAVRRTRIAPDRLRGLERRHEHGRKGRTR